MGNTLQYGDFTVVKSQPATDFSGATISNIVRFTITDAANLLTQGKMIRSVLCDAIQQWIVAERADLDTNLDTTVLGEDAHPGIGDGFQNYDFKFEDKAAEVVLTALTSISSTGNITVERPYADTV